MKNRSLLILFVTSGVCCLLGGAARGKTMPMPSGKPEAQAQDVKPGPEHKILEKWVGDWTYEGQDNPQFFPPGGASAGTVRARPILGGFFVEWQAEERGRPSWREVDGYDPTTKRFFWHAYYADGSTETMTYTMEGDTASLSGTTVVGGKEAHLKGVCVFAPDGQSFVYRLQISLDGRTWEQASEMRFAKVR